MRSYSSRLLMCARSRKCSGGSNLRCSCRTESMLVSEAGMETFSAILIPREAVDFAMLSRTEFYSGEGVLVSEVGSGRHGPQPNRALQVDKLAAVLFRGHRTRVVLPEGAVPIPCDQVVA